MKPIATGPIALGTVADIPLAFLLLVWALKYERYSVSVFFPDRRTAWKDKELPSTPEALRETNVDRIVALGFCDRERLVTKPAIDANVLMTYNDETGEQVMLIIPITDILGRLRMGEDYRNVPPVEGAHGTNWWAELRHRYPKETFWVPRKYRH